VAYAACKSSDIRLGRNCLIFGFVWTVIVGLFWLMFLGAVFAGITDYDSNLPSIKEGIDDNDFSFPTFSSNEEEITFENSIFYEKLPDSMTEGLTANQKLVVNSIFETCVNNASIVSLQSNAVGEIYFEKCMKTVNSKLDEFKPSKSICGEGTIYDSETNSCIVEK